MDDKSSIEIKSISKTFSFDRPQWKSPVGQIKFLIVIILNALRMRKQVLNSVPKYRQFRALHNVSFNLNKGQVLGLIGHNGAGKSTLLKILAKVLAPTSGKAIIHGNVGALLEVGTGFHPDLTGRQNIYLYGAIIGLSRKYINKNIEDIISFAEIESFIDEPIKNYSSGMYSRLAFSVATHLKCDVLLVDEVLATGDARFRSKSMEKMDDVASKSGRSVIFVSHNLQSIVTICDIAALVENGEIKSFGDPSEITRRYIDESNTKIKDEDSFDSKFPPDKSLSFNILNVEIKNKFLALQRNLASSDEVLLCITMQISELNDSTCLTFAIDDRNNNRIICYKMPINKNADIDNIKNNTNILEIIIRLPPNLLRIGKYFCSFYVEEAGKINLSYARAIDFTINELGAAGTLSRVHHRVHLIEPLIEWKLI